jgi:hypothetical protein
MKKAPKPTMDRRRFNSSCLNRCKNKRSPAILVTPIQVKSPPPLSAKSSKDLLVLDQLTDADDKRRVGEPIYRLLEEDQLTSEALIQYLIVHNKQVPSLSKAFWDNDVFRMYHKRVFESLLKEILPTMVNEVVASQQIHFSQDFPFPTPQTTDRPPQTVPELWKRMGRPLVARLMACSVACFCAGVVQATVGT